MVEGPDPLAWARYNPEVMKVECAKCGAPAGSRCRGPATTRITAAHQARYREAGFQWDTRQKRLVPLTD